jgi:NAD(P)-dependent dehydrogenase (short-subunit alcohol dehydrogenase family)
MPEPAVLIIGASGGIGEPLARALASRGARLFLSARDESRLTPLASEFEAGYQSGDATSFEDVQSLVDATVERYGRLDGVVNLAGSIFLKPAHLTSVDEFEETLRQNLFTAFNVVKAASRVMQRNKDPRGGSIVLMSSVAAGLGLVNHEATAAAKAGVEGLTRSAAATYASRHVRVNAVAPGLVRTPMADRLLASEQLEEASAAMHPLGRIGEPEDLTAALIFLLDSDQSAWVTGQVMHVDGGFATVRPR